MMIQGRAMYNVYLFLNNTEAGRRVILAQGVDHAEAEAACRAQFVYLPKLGRIGDTWFSAGFSPRLVIVDADRERADLLDPNPITLDDLLARLSVNYE